MILQILDLEEIYLKKQFDVVFHLAVQSHQSKISDPIGTMDTNVIGSSHLTQDDQDN